MRRSALRLGLVWTIVAQTINGLSLTSDLLNYGAFAQALLDVYRRVREPVFGVVVALAGQVGLDITLVHLDLVLLFSLLSCNALLAMPLVLSRTAEPARSALEHQFRLVRNPLRLIAEGLKAAPIPPFVLAEARRTIAERWADLRDHGNALRAEGRTGRFAWFLLVGVVVMSLVAAIGIPLFILKSALYLALYVVRTVLIAILLILILLLLPLAPITNTAYFVFSRVRRRLRTGSATDAGVRLRTEIRAEVLPWFIPLLSLLGGIFAIYSVDALIRQVL